MMPIFSTIYYWQKLDPNNRGIAGCSINAGDKFKVPDKLFGARGQQRGLMTWKISTYTRKYLASEEMIQHAGCLQQVDTAVDLGKWKYFNWQCEQTDL